MAIITQDILNEAHARTIGNHTNLKPDMECGCFCCLQTFPASAITERVDDGTTALCPYCGIDSVLSSETDRIDQEFLLRMKEYWFDTNE